MLLPFMASATASGLKDLVRSSNFALKVVVIAILLDSTISVKCLTLKAGKGNLGSGTILYSSTSL